MFYITCNTFQKVLYVKNIKRTVKKMYFMYFFLLVIIIIKQQINCVNQVAE